MVSIQSTVDTGHEDMVHDAQMDYYGTRLATCSSDKSVKIFEVKDGTQTLVTDLRGHEGPVWQVAWAHPKYGSILATCSYDRKVILWREDRPGAWSKMYEVTNHDSSVNSVCWAPQEHGLVLAAGSSDGAISILTLSSENQWESTKIPNAHTIGCNAVSWAPFNAAGGPKMFVSGGCDNICKIWRFDEAESKWIEESRLEGHSDWVRDVAWATSIGSRCGRSVIASCSQDRRVLIWTKEGETSQQWTPKELHSFDDVVWHVSWSVSGNMLAVSGGDNKVSLWKETIDGKWVRISDVNKGQGNVNSSNSSAQPSLSTANVAQAQSVA